MFTGLINDIGKVRAISRISGGLSLTIEHKLPSEISLGDSIAVNGICLTAESQTDNAFTAYAVSETLERSNLGSLRPGNDVNLELALRVGDRMGGHNVQGHVDTIGKITRSYPSGKARLVQIQFPPKFSKLVVAEGSIAIDGISLTIKDVKPGPSVVLSVIPETLGRTTIGDTFPGKRVNIEFDVLGKYILNNQKK